MAFIQRDLEPQLLSETPPKAIVLYGSRHIGKKTLVTQLTKTASSVRWFDGDTLTAQNQLQFNSTTDIELTLRQADVIVIEEAQRIQNIGLILKQFVDENIRLNLGNKIVAIANTSLDLAKSVTECAVGRLVHQQMWPLSISEIANHKSWGDVCQNVERLMIYGTYPAVLTDPDYAESTLKRYYETLLYKDLFALPDIRHRDKLMLLVTRLAFNVGKEVSYESLARETGLNKMTVADYLQLLEQCFLIKICPSFSKNLNNELKKGKKVYFCDNGIRNAIIGDFSPMSARRNQDAEALWENFFYMERVKLHSLRNDGIDLYFWRTTSNTPHELDFLEVKNETIRAFDCKLSPNAKARPGKFTTAYPDAPIQVVTPNDLMKLWLLDR